MDDIKFMYWFVMNVLLRSGAYCTDSNVSGGLANFDVENAVKLLV